MNPRVSRSSALASKATGFPIAKAAARLAVGYTLDEITNDITRATPACFEPSIDYCVVKVPRFAFEKFKGTDTTLSTRMKAVGEVMAIGRTFEEAFGKAMRSLEDGHAGLLGTGRDDLSQLSDAEVEQQVRRAHGAPYLLRWPRRCVAAGAWTACTSSRASTRGSLARIADMMAVREAVRGLRVEDIDADAMRLLKQYGASDAEIALLTGSDERFVRAYRKGLGVPPSMKTADTCAAEFSSETQYHYKTYENLMRAGEDARRAVAGRGGAVLQAQGHDLGRGPQPHRPGHRVRLLLRARELRAGRAGLRDHHGELQPRDRVHRLRHERSPVLRTAHL